MLAFTKSGRLGVDVEHRDIRHDIDGEIRKVFSETEQTLLKSVTGKEKEELFLRLWTAKEALIKATGEGFRADTSAFTLPDDIISGSRCSRIRLPTLPNVEWNLVNLENVDFAAAVAHEVL